MWRPVCVFITTDCAELAQLRPWRRLRSTDVFPVGSVQRKEQAQWCLRGYRRDGPQCWRKGNAPIFADKTREIPENLGDRISLRLAHLYGFVVSHRDRRKYFIGCNVSMSRSEQQRASWLCWEHSRHTVSSSFVRTVVSRRVWVLIIYLRLIPFCRWNWSVCMKHTAGVDHVDSSRLGL